MGNPLIHREMNVVWETAGGAKGTLNFLAVVKFRKDIGCPGVLFHSRWSWLTDTILSYLELRQQGMWGTLCYGLSMYPKGQLRRLVIVATLRAERTLGFGLASSDWVTTTLKPVLVTWLPLSLMTVATSQESRLL